MEGDNKPKRGRAGTLVMPEQERPRDEQKTDEQAKPGEIDEEQRAQQEAQPATIDDEPAPAAVDNEPTPIEPPTFDLAELAKAAEELPSRSDAAARPTSRPGNAEPQAGQTLLNYLVLGKHAEGGFACIYELSHIETRERAALKILKPSCRENGIQDQRLLAEGKLLKGNTHPNLCRVMEVGTHDDFGPYIIMELLKGCTLRELMRNENAAGRTITVSLTVELVITIAEVLQAMHDNGAIHRDLKPENVFIVRNADGTIRVVVIDWGAFRKKGVSPSSTHETSVVTPQYMAPEQASRKYAVTALADVYALGIILIELPWQHPFAEIMERDGLQQHEIVGMQIHRALPLAPPHLVPVRLSQIAEKATAKRPQDRYRTMAEFAEELRAFKRERHALAARPAALDIPFRTTSVNSRAKNHQHPSPIDRSARDALRSAPPTPARRVALDELCPNPTMLVIAPQFLRGQRFELGASGTIGRHPAVSNVVIEHPSVSKGQLDYSLVQLDAERPVYSVESVSGSNVAFISGEPIEVAAWRPKEILELGDVRMLLLPAGVVANDLGIFAPLTDPSAMVSEAAAPTEPGPLKHCAPIPRDCHWPRPSLLLILPSSLYGRRFDLGARGIIGRLPDDASVVVDQSSVSAAHLAYTLLKTGPSKSDETVYEVRDLKSSNGSYLVDEKDELIQIERDYLRGHGDVRLGDVLAKLLPPGGPQAGDFDQWVYLEAKATRLPPKRIARTSVNNEKPPAHLVPNVQPPPPQPVGEQKRPRRTRSIVLLGVAVLLISAIGVLIAATISEAAHEPTRTNGSP